MHMHTRAHTRAHTYTHTHLQAASNCCKACKGSRDERPVVQPRHTQKDTKRLCIKASGSRLALVQWFRGAQAAVGCIPA
eukprot:scaffold124698_cov18-Tisochrysis_lutea.AAC.2